MQIVSECPGTEDIEERALAKISLGFWARAG